MEIEINVNELKTELDRIELKGKPSFECAEDEIIYYIHKHEEEAKANRKNDENSIINHPIDEECEETFIDRLKKVWKLILRIYNSGLYSEPEDTSWVTPYDSVNDRLFMGRITKKEWKAIKKKWNI